MRQFQSIDCLREDFGSRLTQLSFLAHVYSSGFQRSVLGQGHSSQYGSSSGFFHFGEKEKACALLLSTRRATETVNISVFVHRKADLDHMSDTGEVHPSRGHIRGQENTTLGHPKQVGCS
jgi:hypothetical protein